MWTIDCQNKVCWHSCDCRTSLEFRTRFGPFIHYRIISKADPNDYLSLETICGGLSFFYRSAEISTMASFRTTDPSYEFPLAAKP
jgi:hypothetical protein